MPRDVTSILMGDPGSSPRRSPRVEEKRAELVPGKCAQGRARATALLAQAANAPIGWEARGVSLYIAHKILLRAKDCGKVMAYQRLPETKSYVVRRVA